MVVQLLAAAFTHGETFLPATAFRGAYEMAPLSGWYCSLIQVADPDTQVLEHHDTISAVGGERFEGMRAEHKFNACYTNGSRLQFTLSLIQGFSYTFQIGVTALLTLIFGLSAKIESPSAFFTVSALVAVGYSQVFNLAQGMQQFIQSAGPVHR